MVFGALALGWAIANIGLSLVLGLGPIYLILDHKFSFLYWSLIYLSGAIFCVSVLNIDKSGPFLHIWFLLNSRQEM
jgi:hypothetical protein